MALSFVGGASITGTGATLTVLLTALTGGSDSAAAIGDIVVVGWGSSNQTDLNLTVSTSGYTELADLYANGTNDTNFAVAYKVLSSAETNVIVSGSNSAVFAGVAVAHVWRDINSGAPIDVTSTTTTNTGNSNINNPSITPVTSGAIVMAWGGCAADITRTFTVPSGYGNATQATLDPDEAFAVCVATKAWVSGAEDPGAWTPSATNAADSWAAVTVVLRPSATTSTPLLSLMGVGS